MEPKLGLGFRLDFLMVKGVGLVQACLPLRMCAWCMCTGGKPIGSPPSLVGPRNQELTSAAAVCPRASIETSVPIASLHRVVCQS